MTREDVRTLLGSLVPHDAREADHLARMQALSHAAGDPFSRGHFDPGHFTASAFVLSPAGDALLLILHAKLGRWLQPGGHVDPEDDSLLATARREAMEEVGLAELPLDPRSCGVFDVDVHDIPAHGLEPAHAHFDVRYVFRATTLGFVASEEVQGGRWVPLDEVSTRQTDESVMRAVRKIQALALPD